MSGPIDKSRVWSPTGGGARSHVIAPFSEIELVPTALHVHPPLDEDLPPTVLVLPAPVRDARTARTELIIAVTGELFEHVPLTPPGHRRREVTRVNPKPARTDPRAAEQRSPPPVLADAPPSLPGDLGSLRRAIALVPVPALLALLLLGLATGAVGGALLALWLTR